MEAVDLKEKAIRELYQARRDVTGRLSGRSSPVGSVGTSPKRKITLAIIEGATRS